LAPETRYTRSGDVNIAFQVLGEGPGDLVFVPGYVSNIEVTWEEPAFSRFLTRLAGFSRLILFDKRGTGLSDRVADMPSLEIRMDDVRAVMDAVGSRRAAIFGFSEGGPMSALFAATFPQRTTALLMQGAYARRAWAPDYPWGMSDAQFRAWIEQIDKEWGGPIGIEIRAKSMLRDEGFRRWFARYLRMGASPAAAGALVRMIAEIDIRDVLQTIRVPTLILHSIGDGSVDIRSGRYLAEHIPGAKYVELPGPDHRLS
jgi:pimeloyl-ACP methyl ester carboxylesterase